MMEPRRSSKKTRSYGGAPRSARNHENTPATGTGSRPQYKERVKSAPLGISPPAQSQQHRGPQQASTGSLRRESQASDTVSGLLSPPSPARQQDLPPQRHSGNSQVNLSNIRFRGKLMLIMTQDGRLWRVSRSCTCSSRWPCCRKINIRALCIGFEEGLHITHSKQESIPGG